MNVFLLRLQTSHLGRVGHLDFLLLFLLLLLQRTPQVVVPLLPGEMQRAERRDAQHHADDGPHPDGPQRPKVEREVHAEEARREGRGQKQDGQEGDHAGEFAAVVLGFFEDLARVRRVICVAEVECLARSVCEFWRKG